MTNSSIGIVYPTPNTRVEWEKKHWLRLYFTEGFRKCRINLKAKGWPSMTYTLREERKNDNLINSTKFKIIL